MKKIRYIILIAPLLLVGCNYLNMVPEKDIETVETMFEMRASADNWINGLYGAFAESTTSLNSNVAFLGSDEIVAGEALRKLGYLRAMKYDGFKIAEGLQMSQEPYGDFWDPRPVTGGMETVTPYVAIRYCNMFLDNIHRVYNMTQEEKLMWSGEIQALKAWQYFELVRRYGPIILAPTNLEINDGIANLQQQRQHVDTCFKAIVDLLDVAIENLPYGNQRSSDRLPYFNKESAMALKARVLVYAASPLFNGNEFYSTFTDKEGKPLFSKVIDKNKWKLAAEAADAAIYAARVADHKLFEGKGGEKTAILNTMKSVENSVLSRFGNPEFIIEAKGANRYILFLPLLKSSSPHYTPDVTGAASPSMKMVEMFYTENGLPIDQDQKWGYANRYKMSQETSVLYANVVPLKTDVLRLHLRREPRFYANIAADRTYWIRGPLGGFQDNNLLVDAYKGEVFGSQYNTIQSDNYQNINGYWIKKFMHSSLPTRGYKDDLNETFPVMRMAELYLLAAEAWNEYLDAPDARVYEPLNEVRKRAGIMDVVTAWKSYSNDPGRVDNKEGMRNIIHQETNIELCFEGHRFFNLRRWKEAHIDLNEKQYGWNILGETAQTFYNNFNGPVVVWSKCKFTSPRDYLFPIKAEQILISSVVQNPGW